LNDDDRDVIVGVNKYRLDSKEEEEERQEVLQIDNSAVRDKQVKRLQELKSKRNNDEVNDALSALEASANMKHNTSKGNDHNNLMVCTTLLKWMYALGKSLSAREAAFPRLTFHSWIDLALFSTNTTLLNVG